MKTWTLPVALVLLAVFIIAGVVGLARHEMWRDEMQAWLLAKDHVSLPGLVQATRYEKHPMAWFFVLFILSRVTAAPWIMQAFHLLLAALSVWLVLRYSPFNLAQKVLLAFGYYLLFEYGLISRNYALGVLCLFLFCVFYPRFRRKPLVLSLPLFVLANTSVYGLIMAMALGLVLAVDVAGGEGLRRQWPSWAALGVVGLGGLLSYLQLRPVGDSLYDQSAVVHLQWNTGLIHDVLKLIPRAFLPLPQFIFHFWNTSLLDRLSLPLLGELAATVLFVLLAVVLVRRQRAALMFYLLGTLGLLAWFYLGQVGFTRHYGMLFIVFIGALWLARTPSPEPEAGTAKAAAGTAAGSRWLNAALTAVLLVQFVAGVYAWGMDLVYPFSQSKNVARVIHKRGYQKLPIVADVDYVVSPVCGYLGRRMYYPRSGRLGSYIVWDTHRLPRVKSWLVLTWAERYAWMKDSDCLILTSYSLEKAYESSDTVQLLTKTPPAIVGDEHYSLYLFKHKRPLSPAAGR